MTVALSAAVPPGPVTVMVYAVVTEGETLVDPVRGTVPTPWSILALVASVELHESVAESPDMIVSGDAVILTVGGSFTVTVTLSVAVPPRPEAVIVYVVVIAGETRREPFTATSPMP